ncbi:hypothetical protein EYB53_022540 [Candidatus Chloroploca sp. M-50]|uniref:DUF4190 domain-containing protein n=1 Tax=Candidatus Chloroploca mongolica TaxID=2528176 RepID=A0ABS4DGE8_9CHLR|nr:hypothetical protein [Candidatus Chloroploca mongolica]MBP1468508.1 hypothetical protein [Candidatus Chloroploca mongolica]
MNINQNQARNAGLILIVLGVVAIFNLWALIPPALLAVGGVAIYRRQKALGRTGEAVQGMLWGVGLAALLGFNVFTLPGVLLLAGASLLLRGREAQAEARLFATVGRLSRRRTPVTPTAQPMNVQPAQPMLPAEQLEQSTRTNETVRLS